jgi:hypothetical protein
VKKTGKWAVSVSGAGLVGKGYKFKTAKAVAKKVSKDKQWKGRSVIAFLTYVNGKKSCK